MIKLWLGTLLITLFCLPLKAQIRPDPNTVGFEVMALYMKPMWHYPYYTMTTEANTAILFEGTRKANEFKYHGGFGLIGMYVFPCASNDLRVMWTHFQETAIDQVVSNAIPGGVELTLSRDNPTIALIRNIHSEAHFKYDAVETLLGYIPIQNCHVVSYHLGMLYAKIQYDEEDLFDASVLGQWNLKMEGIGPEFAILCKYLLPISSSCSHFYIDGKADCGVVIGRLYSHFALKNLAIPSERTDPFFDTTNDRTYRGVPFWNVAVGASSDLAFHSILLECEIGYTFTHYHKAFDSPVHVTTPNFSSTVELFSDIFLHGLYFSVGVTY